MITVTVLTTYDKPKEPEQTLETGSTVDDVCRFCLGVDPLVEPLAIRVEGVTAALDTVIHDGQTITIFKNRMSWSGPTIETCGYRDTPTPRTQADLEEQR